MVDQYGERDWLLDDRKLVTQASQWLGTGYEGPLQGEELDNQFFKYRTHARCVHVVTALKAWLEDGDELWLENERVKDYR